MVWCDPWQSVVWVLASDFRTNFFIVSLWNMALFMCYSFEMLLHLLAEVVL
jgi:hypothetical protein